MPWSLSTRWLDLPGHWVTNYKVAPNIGLLFRLITVGFDPYWELLNFSVNNTTQNFPYGLRVDPDQ